MRSGKKICDNPDKRIGFQKCSIQQGNFIRSGGLRCSSHFQQVSKHSFENLARINECGFITVDSVDAHESRPDDRDSNIQTWVHPTITGFMLPETFIEFKKTYSEFMPSVCLIHHIIVNNINSVDFYGSTNQERIIMPVNYFYYGERAVVQSNVRLYFSQSDLDGLKKQVHLKPDEPVEFITLVDMRGKHTANEERGLFTILREHLSNK